MPSEKHTSADGSSPARARVEPALLRLEPALPRVDVWIALAIGVALALFWTIPLSDAQAWGWDESMHAELPAARMAVALQLGDVRAFFEGLHSCSQYPFAWPLALAALQLFTGISEHAARSAGTLAWCVALFGIFCVARELVHGLRRARGPLPFDRGVPFVALLLGALCPLALAFAGTLFLEVPATCAIVWALHAWLVRARCLGTPCERRAQLVASAAIALAFFTKFNYGLMLALALALDWSFDLVRQLRAGTGARFVRTSAWLLPIPLVLLAWWFVLPLPLGAETASEHRVAFASFLRGNQAFQRFPDSVRLLYLGDWFALSPGWLLLQLALAALALRRLRVAAVRAVALLALATTLPIALHPFHDARFQVVIGPALWLLAAVGWRTLRGGSLALRCALLLLLGAAIVPMQWQRRALQRAVGALADDGPLREYQLEQLDAWNELSGDRALPTAGLPRDEFDALGSLIAANVGADERVGWIGIPTEFSPAALHLALLQHGGSRERFLRECARTLDVTYFGDDPQWGDARLAEFAAGFDVILGNDPIDLKGSRHTRDFLKQYRERLIASGWHATVLGRVSTPRPLKPALEATLTACRPGR